MLHDAFFLPSLLQTSLQFVILCPVDEVVIHTPHAVSEQEAQVSTNVSEKVQIVVNVVFLGQVILAVRC